MDSKKIFLMSVVISLLVVSAVAAFWPFTGKVTGEAVRKISGKCISESDEVDGEGRQLEIAGTIEYEKGWFRRKRLSVTDKCQNEEKLTEYYCVAKTRRGRTIKRVMKETNIECEYGCEQTEEGGQCKSAPPAPTWACTDSDDGNEPETAGVAIQKSTPSGEKGDGSYMVDKCRDGSLKEASCGDDGKLAGLIEYKCSDECQKEDLTIDGTPHKEVGSCTPQAKQCSENDVNTEGDGNNPLVKGVTVAIDQAGKTEKGVDKCKANILTEYYCEADEIKSTQVDCTTKGEDIICIRGACVGVEALCTDTDAGKSYGEKGTVTTDQGEVSDYCPSQSVLGEFFCREKGKPVAESKTNHRIFRVLVKCAKGCSDGLCVDGEITDRGFDEDLKEF